MTNREPTPAGAAMVAIAYMKTRNEVLIEVSGTPRCRHLSSGRADPIGVPETIPSRGRHDSVTEVQ